MNAPGHDPDLREDGLHEDEVHDDRVIGAAFRWSLLAALALVAIAGVVLLVLYLRGAAQVAPVQDAHVDLAVLARASTAPEPPVARYTDVTRAAGIDFVHDNGAVGERLLPETMGGGVAFLDVDRDGDQDLLFVDSGPWPGSVPPGRVRGALRLYANDGHGRYTDTGAHAGLDGVRAYGMGVAVGDVDGDGWIDVFLTAVGGNRLLRNVQGRFVDITERAGVGGDASAWSTGAAFLDHDRDGDLDLVVVDYVRWSRAIDFAVDYRLTGLGRAYGPPTNFEGSHVWLYRNDGDARYSEVSEQAGLHVVNAATGVPVGKGLAVHPLDFDGDGLLDLFIANDTVRNFAFRNLGDGRFEELGTPWGVALDRNGHATGAMGVDSAHYRNDAALALAIGNFANEMSSFYVDESTYDNVVQFADQSIVEGLGPATRRVLSFGLLFLDYDLDGRLDLLQANGHVENDIAKVQASQSYRQPAQLFWNCGEACAGTWLEVPRDRTGDLGRPIAGRGAAYADIDGDGDLDVVLTQIDGAPLLLRNDRDGDAHWLRLQLAGRAPNTAAIGASVELHAGGIVQRRSVMPTRSYLSQVELPLTFGLGDTARIERLVVRWPDGSQQILSELAVDRLHRIDQQPAAPKHTAAPPEAL